MRWYLLSIIVTALVMSACSHAPVHEKKPAPTAPPAGHAIEGHYVLSSYGGRALPAPIDHQRDCHTRLDSARLKLKDGHFRLSESLSRYCQDVLRGRTLKRGAGAYRVQDGHLKLTSSAGELFQSARGRVRRQGLTLNRLTRAGQRRKVRWVFDLQSGGHHGSFNPSGSGGNPR